jgi:hypothetical protein
MCRRILSAVLIALILAAGSVAPARAQQEEGQTKQGEKITPDEEREAAQIAERVIKGLEEKNNLSTLVDELYVKDFEARLRRNPSQFTYLAKVEPDVAAKASDQELRRFYIASINFMYAVGFLYGLNLYDMKVKGIEGDDDPPLDKLLPPEVLKMMKDDLLMAEVLAEDAEDKERAGKSEPSDDAEKITEAGREEKADGCEIRSLERLRDFILALEKISALLREHLKTVQGPHTWEELINALKSLGAMEEARGDCEGTCPRVYVLGEEFFGTPTETRLICVNVLFFHMDLVRVDGHLRILSVYMAGD